MSAEELLAGGTVTLEDATREFGIGRTRLYDLMQSGRLPYAQLGGRRLIPRVALRQLLAAVLVGVATAPGDPQSGRGMIA